MIKKADIVDGVVPSNQLPTIVNINRLPVVFLHTQNISLASGEILYDGVASSSNSIVTLYTNRITATNFNPYGIYISATNSSGGNIVLEAGIDIVMTLSTEQTNLFWNASYTQPTRVLMGVISVSKNYQGSFSSAEVGLAKLTKSNNVYTLTIVSLSGSVTLGNGYGLVVTFVDSSIPYPLARV